MKKFKIKLHLLSDTHNEFYREDPTVTGEIRAPDVWDCTIPETDADVIVLAGDIDVGLEGVHWAIGESKRLKKPIVYVCGNHEFYYNDIPLLLERMKDVVKNTDVHVLENDEVTINGTRFLGCTLWTDYKLNGGPTEDAMEDCSKYLSDHRLVQDSGEPFQPLHALRRHEVSVQWLEERLRSTFTGHTVVVTHHGPSPACQHPSFTLDTTSAGFHSNLNYLVALADLWVYGHTHSNLDTIVEGPRLVSNQAGYPKSTPPDFDSMKTILL